MSYIIGCIKIFYISGKFLSVEEVYKNKYGDCHDQANFEVYFLKKMNLKCGREFMVEYIDWNSPGGATHTIAWYIQNNKYYWIENAWGDQAGIHGPYKSLKELKDYIASIWQYSGKNMKLYMHDFKSVKSGASLNEYVNKNTPENEPEIFYSKEVPINSKVLEALLISDNMITLEGLFGNNDHISDTEIKRSQYYNMTDRDLATIMVDRLYNNQTIRLATKDDPSVAKPMQLMRVLSYEYFEYNINGIPVAVAKAAKNNKESSFTVYAYIPKMSNYAKGITTPKTELIRSFIMEDKQK